MKNKISKIILAASLLASGITTAQEFYTCVPKRDWWIEMVREGSKKWKKIIHLTPQSPQSDFQQTLQPGKYKVIAAGGGGEPETKEFTLTSSQEFKACAGGNYDGMGYKGKYSSYSEGGYGKGNMPNNGGNMMLYNHYVIAAKGCYMGVKPRTSDTCIAAGSYFQIADIEMVLQGCNGIIISLIPNVAPTINDGYVIIERLE